MPFVNVVNQQIYFAETGIAQTYPPIIFIHGAAGSHLVWGLQLRALADLTRAIAIDLPGHGRSTLPGRNTIADYRDVILALLDALKLERAIIAGHSMGGAIAQSLALAHPARIAGLVLIGTGARLRVLQAILDGVLTDFDATAELVVDNSYAQLDEAMRARAIAEFRACPAEVTHGDFSACNGFDIMPRLGEIHAPTLILCGAQDKMTPVKYSQFLASNLRNAKLVVIENAGHSVMIEQADAVNPALREFILNLAVHS
jgi:pimeloyl-ACP methyl ester carboxylesterase